MKKLLRLGLLLYCVLILAACSGKSDGVSDEVYDIGCEILSITDQYMHADITIQEAGSKIDTIYEKFEDEYSEQKDEMIKLYVNFLRGSFSLKDEVAIKDGIEDLKVALEK